MQDLIRQGDLLFVPLKDWEDVTKYATRVTDGILAKGEATGHHHRVAELEAVEVYRTHQDDVFLRVGPGGVSIEHEEHKPVALPAGDYRMHQAREFDYLAGLGRRVRD